MWQTPYGDANTLVTCRIWGIRPPATLDQNPPYLFQNPENTCNVGVQNLTFQNIQSRCWIVASHFAVNI